MSRLVVGHHRALEAGIVACLATLAVIIFLLAQGSSVVGRWFYLFSWYPVLIAMDLWVARLGGTPLLAKPKALPAMLWWSAIIWLVFEVFNFALKNWYYVNAEPQWTLRWAGTLLAFATVIPAIFLPERILDQFGVGRRWNGRAVQVSERDLRIAFWSGWVVLAAMLLSPRYLFPFVWGAVWLVVEPVLWKQSPNASLWRDMAAGRWGRIGRLLLAGFVAGLIWEALNLGAQTKWIYTVPFLEELKLFEMPLLGFLGFPVFALEAWSIYHLIVARSRPVTSVVGSVTFIVVALVGMERWTVSSTAPRIADLLTTTSAGVVEAMREAGYEDVFVLARTDSVSLMHQTGLSLRDANTAWQWARLVTLRGIGSEHAERLARVGVTSVAALALADPRELAERLADGARPTAAEVRVWVRAAGRAMRDGERNRS